MEISGVQNEAVLQTWLVTILEAACRLVRISDFKPRQT